MRESKIIKKNTFHLTFVHFNEKKKQYLHYFFRDEYVCVCVRAGWRCWCVGPTVWKNGRTAVLDYCLQS